MDSGGKVIMARHNEISTVDIKKLDADVELGDGERLVLAAKELDVCEIYPQSLHHNSNGRFGVVTVRRAPQRPPRFACPGVPRALCPS